MAIQYIIQYNMPFFPVSKVLDNYFLFNNHNGAGSTGGTRVGSLSYIGNIMQSYDTTICKYSQLHNVYTVYNHTAQGVGMISKTVSKHINALIRNLQLSGANINIVNRSYNNHLHHTAALHNILNDMIRKQKIKEIIRVNAFTHTFEKNILKYHLLPFM